MSLVVVTGGARSGKSGVAQRLADSHGAHVTVAVFASPEGDTEMATRIRRHHEDRSRGWRVIEPGTGSAWVAAVPAQDVLVLDCLGTLLGNLMLKDYEARGLGRFARAKHLPENFEEG
ncbi:MAG: bifunctional adenosylcobinamide kinase/adenosylcobinamide-phosphate guanylyltransferase, partial [Coriobacteriia bacterium]|nr:bifunctional adenosylcobinamide kinase/adenosylcobinamide-phosphate guanylyltransferase [Coriobacteriia bacterium]